MGQLLPQCCWSWAQRQSRWRGPRQGAWPLCRLRGSRLGG
jgi:hypothetical protein